MPPAASVEFRLLGPLEVMVNGRVLRLGGERQRALLGVLLLNAGRTVSVETIIDGVWGDVAPESARHLVQVYVSQLRSIFGTAVALETKRPGYTIRLRQQTQTRCASKALSAGRSLLPLSATLREHSVNSKTRSLSGAGRSSTIFGCAETLRRKQHASTLCE